MQEIVARLLELQELEITKNEATILHGESEEISDIEEKITKLREGIDVDALSRYDRLSRHGLGVVSVMNDMCLGCNMTIPKGDLNRMESGKQDAICPHCSRYLKL